MLSAQCKTKIEAKVFKAFESNPGSFKYETTVKFLNYYSDFLQEEFKKYKENENSSCPAFISKFMYNFLFGFTDERKDYRKFIKMGDKKSSELCVLKLKNFKTQVKLDKIKKDFE